MNLDPLAIAAHPDDAELTCGGTLALAVRQGHKVGILDLVAGETGTRGSAAERTRQADPAARGRGVHVRANAGRHDAPLHNGAARPRAVVALIRKFRPRTVILPFPIGRPP